MKLVPTCIALVLVLSPTVSRAQSAPAVPDTLDPVMIGGLGSIRLNYPEVARRANIEGTVHLSFIVSESGFPTSVEVITGVHHLLDAEATRAILQTRFVPGKIGGVAVRTRYSIPVVFRLTDDAPRPTATAPRSIRRLVTMDRAWPGGRVRVEQEDNVVYVRFTSTSGERVAAQFSSRSSAREFARAARAVRDTTARLAEGEEVVFYDGRETDLDHITIQKTARRSGGRLRSDLSIGAFDPYQPGYGRSVHLGPSVTQLNAFLVALTRAADRIE